MMLLWILTTLMLLQLPLLYHFPAAPTMQDCSYELGIVLGCPSMEDGSVSRTQKSRMNKAIQLYQAGRIKRLLISGAGVRNTFIEADVMAAYALEKKIPSSAILLEKEAMNTYDNLKNAYEICEQQHITSVVVITSRFHIRRSSFFVKKFFNHYAMCPTDEKERWKHSLEEYVRMWNTLRIEYKIRWQDRKKSS